MQVQDASCSPQKAFRRNLQEYLLSCRAKGQDILLTGDFNESIGKDPDSMAKLTQQCKLINLVLNRTRSSQCSYKSRLRAFQFSLSN